MQLNQSGNHAAVSTQEKAMLKHDCDSTVLDGLPEVLTDEQLELACGGERTCVQVCEKVAGSSATVCGPMICM
jgi:hypothetical protein